VKYNEPDTIQTETEAPSSLSSVAPGEIIIGTLVEIGPQGHPLVAFSDNKSTLPRKAMTTLSLTPSHIGRQVALLFANGDINNPVIMGMIHSPLQDMLENYEHSQSENKSDVELETDLKVDDVLLDGNKIVFEAKEQIVLKCGESSITLTKAGKIMIRGKYLLNRSTGVNRILGGSVQVN